MEDIILINYLKGEASQEECVRIEAWTEASEDNRKALEQLYYALFLGERYATIKEVNVENSLAEFKQKAKQKEEKGKRSFGWKQYAVNIAAFMTGILVAGSAIWTLSNNDASSYMVSTEAGQRAQITLPDGTHAWLNASTHLAYKKSFWGNKRQVELIGEAYFEITPNKHAPFIVNSKNIKVKALGTKFNIRANTAEERVVTTLLSGSVQVSTPECQEGLLLRPGQTLDIDVETQKAKLTKNAQPEDVLLWINGKLSFNQATLATITNTLEKHYDVLFTFENAQLKNERYTCDFSTDNDITEILSIIALTKRLTYQKEGKNVHIMNK